MNHHKEVPSHSLEMEMAVLGSVMLDPKAFKQVQAIIKASSFYRPSHRVIWTAIEWLVSQGKATGYELVIERLREKDELKDIGGTDYVYQVSEYVPSSASAKFYAEEVAKHAEKRAYVEAARKLIQMTTDGESEMEAIRAFVAKMPFIVSRPSPFVDISEITVEGDDVGIPCGVKGVDLAVSTKGVPQGQMSVISAYHKAGKSTFMVQCCANQCSDGKRVMYATFADLNGTRLKRRLLRSVSGWSKAPSDLIARGEYDLALREMDQVWDLTIYDASKADNETIEGFLGMLEAKHLEKPFDCVYIDYAQKLTSSARRASMGGVAEGDWISHVISRAAEKLNLAIVVGSQITEGGKDGKTITKGSRKWEEDAGLVLRVKRENLIDATIEIAYSRFGGMGTEVKAEWDNKHLRFNEI